MHWLDSLTEPQREKAHEYMRYWWQCSIVYEGKSRELTAPCGTVGIGAAHHEWQVKANLLNDVISSLGKGLDPDAATDYAKAETTSHTRRLNTQLDYVCRWYENHGHDWIDREVKWFREYVGA